MRLEADIRLLGAQAGLWQLFALLLLLFIGFISPAAAEPTLPAAASESNFKSQDMAAVALGRLLFFDAALSGNKQVSCATCHHPKFGTSDGLSLSIGDGGEGLGTDRKFVAGDNQPEQRIGRHSPALFNLGADEFEVLFHDGRLEADAKRAAAIRSPLEEDMALGFTDILSAQAMFPVLSGDEMAGHYSENDVSKAVRQGILTAPGGAWEIIARRVQAIPAYDAGFATAYGKSGDAIGFADIANAIGAFIAFEFRADNSPFDQYLRGEDVLQADALAGMELFYGKAQCSQCHSGTFQTDHQFHAIAMPQLGPGKAARFETHQRDVGRMRVTGKTEDIYKFRTPSLRNVTLTAPYSHAGAYATLEAVVRHHLDPAASLTGYDRTQALLPVFPDAVDWAILDDPLETSAIAAANELEPFALTDQEIDQLLAFLNALTDPVSIEGRLGVPETVPSGLPVD